MGEDRTGGGQAEATVQYSVLYVRMARAKKGKWDEGSVLRHLQARWEIIIVL